MAIAIEATVFVNEVKQLDFGHILKCGHPHRYKAEAGDWVTASTTFLDIIIRNNKTAEFQDFLQLEPGTRIAVKGFGKPTAYTKKDGTVGSTLQLEVTEITVLENRQEADAPF